MLYVFATIFGFAYAGLTPPITAMVGDTFGIQHIGLIIGTLEIGWGLGAATGPALAGYIFDVSGSYFLAFLITMVAMLIATILVLFMKTTSSYYQK